MFIDKIIQITINFIKIASPLSDVEGNIQISSAYSKLKNVSFY